MQWLWCIGMLLVACSYVSAPVRNQSIPLVYKPVPKETAPRKKLNIAPVVKLRTKFIWPTQGKIIQRFNPEKGEKGIDMTGILGQSIQAVADGKVVYSGQGLLGYGNLIIIKHDELFLSAYAHNQTILVREGEKIKQGTVIATMGSTGTDRVKLHFELRQNGKPSDPLQHLPQR